MRESVVSVMHCFRAPVGGLFRHVRDLIRHQSQAGLKVGLICDSSTGGERAEDELKQLKQVCDLGVIRMPIARQIGVSDLSVMRQILNVARDLSPDIIHGHGAKGGAYSRLIARRVGALSVYTPHGGTLHYSPLSPIGIVYYRVERMLKLVTDGIIFESQYAANAYAKNVGKPSCPVSIIHNGLYPSEFSTIEPGEDAFDFVCIGELRKLKGIEVLLDATAMISSVRPVTIGIVGMGPDETYFRKIIEDRGLQSSVTLLPPIYPIGNAFAMGHCVAMPSLAESLPYIVLEAIAARKPLLVTAVGGVPEIVGPHAEGLLPPNDPQSLANAMSRFLDNPQEAQLVSNRRAEYVRAHFDVIKMGNSISDFYQTLMHSQ